MRIAKTYRFESAHELPWHLGKCHNLHGHSYVMEVMISGDIQTNDDEGPEAGMVIDFAALDKIVKPEIAERWDHKYLNTIMVNPTAELIAEWWFWFVEGQLPHGVLCQRVTVWETENCCAICDRGDLIEQLTPKGAK